MRQISINSQEDLNRIVSDTAIDGEFSDFYEMLVEALKQHSSSRIKQMKGALIFTVENDYDPFYKGEKPIDELTDLEILYFYSLLP